MNGTEKTIDTALYAAGYEQFDHDFTVGAPTFGSTGSIHARLDKDEVTGAMYITTWAHGPSHERLFVIRVPYK